MALASLTANSVDDFLKTYIDSLSKATGTSKDKIANATINSIHIWVKAAFNVAVSNAHAQTGFATAASVPESQVAVETGRRLTETQDSDYFSDVKESSALRRLGSTITATITVPKSAGQDIVAQAKIIHTAVNDPANVAAKVGAAAGATMTVTLEAKFIVKVSADVYSQKDLPEMSAINEAMSTTMSANITGTNSVETGASTNAATTGSTSRAFSGRIHVAFVACVLMTLTSRLGL
jgi:hypothetical protein